MTDLIVILILLILIGAAVSYIIKAKKSGVKCIGCPAGGSCPSSRKLPKKKLAGSVLGKEIIKISGMTCDHCAASVMAALNQIDGVSADVKLAKGSAVVSYDREIADSVLRDAVEKRGYKVTGIIKG